MALRYAWVTDVLERSATLLKNVVDITLPRDITDIVSLDGDRSTLLSSIVLVASDKPF